jgi:uncharacterized repeat protein (TIGR02543 family)
VKKNKKLASGLLAFTIATGGYLITGCDNPDTTQPQETTYNIKYYLDGGINNDLNPDAYKPSDATFSLKDASKSGYTFVGWYREQSFTTQVTTIDKGSRGHLELYAKFVPVTYTIQYDLDDGELTKQNPTSYNIGSENITLNNPTKTGYTFVGWKDEDTGSVVQFRRILKGTTGNKRYTAIWELTVYNITTVSRHGMVEVASGANLGNNVTFNVVPNDGYEVDYIEINGERFDETKNSFVMPNENVEIEVGYKLITYTITYLLDGGVNNIGNVTTYDVETDEFSLLEPTKEGHTFVGWRDEETQTITSSVTIIRGTFGNKTYTAVWSPNAYNINFESLHGYVDMVGGANFGSTVTFDVTPYDGYKLVAVYVNGVALDDITTGSFIMPAGDTDVEFVYDLEQYVVDYVLNGGTNHSENKNSYNIDEGFDLYDPTKEGYVFVGWYKDADFTVPYTPGDIGNLTLYAQFAQASVDGVYYETLADAIDAASEQSTVVILGDISIDSTITINKQILIHGQNAVISASDEFEGNGMFVIEADNKIITFGNVTIDARQKTRVIKASAGNVTLIDANITGGYVENYVSGVYITGTATLSMTGGTIMGNTIADRDDYLQYATDLWIGSQARGTVVTIDENAYVENVFVNANSYKADNGGTFKLSGGEIKNLYVEYADEKSASFVYEEGEVEELMISTTTTGEYVKVSADTGMTYYGGHTIFNETKSYMSLEEAIEDADAGDTILLTTNATIDATIVLNKSINIESYGVMIETSDSFEGAAMFIIEDANANVSFENILLNANQKCRVIRANAGHLSLTNSIVTGGYSSSYVAGVYITNYATFEMSGGRIDGNTIADRDDYLQYATDLWVGSQASGVVTNLRGNVFVGSAFINANSYKTAEGGMLTLENGMIDNLYIEYADDRSAIFNYSGGLVNNLMISTTTTGVYESTSGANHGVYYGGKLAKVEDSVNHEFAYYSTLKEAIENANDNDIVHVLANSKIHETITLTKSIMITGNKETIKATDDFAGNAMFIIDENVNVTFNYLTLDANQKCRVIRANAGHLTLRDTHVTGGYSSSYIAGVYITNYATFEMHGGSILNNTIADKDDYLQYATDLWVGSQASGTVATVSDDARIGNVFVNANNYKTEDGGLFTLNGGIVNTVYVEYDEEKAAKFNYVKGSVTNLLISTTNTGIYEVVKAENLTPKIYLGGVSYNETNN